MNVIPFPTNRRISDIKKKENAIAAQHPPASTSSGLIGITCPYCNHVAKVVFHGTVFKKLDCHCMGCGKFHRITNPAFAAPPEKEQKK